jgi:hypothetical protein
VKSNHFGLRAHVASSSLTQQLRQLGDIRRNPSRLILRQQLRR